MRGWPRLGKASKETSVLLSTPIGFLLGRDTVVIHESTLQCKVLDTSVPPTVKFVAYSTPLQVTMAHRFQ